MCHWQLVEAIRRYYSKIAFDKLRLTINFKLRHYPSLSPNEDIQSARYVYVNYCHRIYICYYHWNKNILFS